MLASQNTWRIVKAPDFPKIATILVEIFILAIKYEGRFNEIWTALFVVQEHKNLMQSSLMQNISVARQQFKRLIVSL